MMLAAFTAMGIQANVLDSVKVDVRLGYTVGGTLPTHIGHEIRGINNFNLGLNFTIAAEATLPLNKRWALHSGLRYEIGGMDVDSRVKNYDIEVVKGDESLSGVFNGNVRIKSAQRRISLPIQAAYNLSDAVTLRGGLFMGWLTHRRFWGWAYDGYMREGTPIGAKIELGTEPGDRATLSLTRT